MHLLRVETRSIDGTAEAVDLDQTPADIVALSFTDTDLAVLAAAWEAQSRHVAQALRLANLSALRHPFSVDLYLEKGDRQGKVRSRSPARRHGLLALRGRRVGDAGA